MQDWVLLSLESDVNQSVNSLVQKQNLYLSENLWMVYKKKKQGVRKKANISAAFCSIRQNYSFASNWKKHEVMVFTSENKQHKAVIPKRNETSVWALWLLSLQPGKIILGGEEKRNSEPSYPFWTEEPVHKQSSHYKYFVCLRIQMNILRRNKDKIVIY